MRIIVAISGGKASAYCAGWALKAFPNDEVIFYFNDTLWEHPDLYRFISDLSERLKHPIHYDTDGRSPEQLFYDQHALANNRMPFCSRILKAERLQKYYKDGDIIIFGIDKDEIHRAERIISVYQVIAAKTGKFCKILFPLITDNIGKQEIDNYLQNLGILEPELYSLGFYHNNCSGGCVRAGKRQWKLLYEKLPAVYLDRERVEKEVGAYLQKNISFLKDTTLEAFRGKIERGELCYTPSYVTSLDCIGICSSLA